ncbi:MAG TPA: 1-deoxy-D-xylulose-5-phosphate synthase [Spirochaetota bacterium]|nr:1-deoxy-D-xylulose-5-phosphate synthase [Spirochaetota bacterium]HPI90359.1 1-deoxy-D-xylulose-5-phosphate synthase [Spirochaetota bacterium]HPR48473.1 1-deoxy-D-xylulose-5-phosphate synthase [Spirochaetota bacterium]
MNSILKTLKSTRELKLLSRDEASFLCEEIRTLLINTAHENGGHLASNLGVVELTVALHRVFNSPKDKIIWDVGHQCYTHKILTGRKQFFSTIRRHEGLSGFPDPMESSHDPVYSGHAGTSVSSTVGIAAANTLLRSNDRVIAVIGDGSLGAGIALEAINHAGHTGMDLTIILNDNGMSISPTVGSICKALQKIRLGHRYRTANHELNKRIPLLPFGEKFLDITGNTKRIIKKFMLPGTLWEEMGLQYIGPVDGHDLAELENVLEKRRDAHYGPAIIHVITKKGKGYSPAEDNAVKFHGISPSAVKNVLPHREKEKQEKSYSSIFADSLIDIMNENERVVAITAAMTDGTGLSPVAETFPRRVFDVGICEQHAVTMAAGLASQGFIPVVAIYSTFLQRAYDQIIHDVCLQGLPVVFAIDRAGIVGDDGKTHQGIFDLSFLRCVPGLTIAAPKDGNELRNLLATAIASRRPFVIRYPRGAEKTSSASGAMTLSPGKGEILRTGKDCAILAIGSMVYPALAAAEQLKNAGIDCAVANMRFVKPLDRNLIVDLAGRTGMLITVEENVAAGGFGSAVMELLCDEKINDVVFSQIGLPDEFVEHGNQNFMRSKFGLDPGGIARQVWYLYSNTRHETIKQRVGV